MNRPSTQNLQSLIYPAALRQLCKSLSVLEAIICQDWESRYYSYQKNWSEIEACCEMRNGSGDQMLILFRDEGICINGFAHESEMSNWRSVPVEEKKSFFEKIFGSEKEKKTRSSSRIWPGVLDDLPEIFNDFIFGEPVKGIGTTFCIWNTPEDTNWKVGEIDFPNNEYKDGSSDLLELLDGKPSTYKNWVEEYYVEDFEERGLKLKLVENIYAGKPLTKEWVMEINPELADWEQLVSDLDEIGYEYNF